MTREQRSQACYQELFDSTRCMIMSLSGLSSAALNDMGCELGTNYDFFLAEYQGQYLFDSHVGFLEMLRQDPVPWPYNEYSSLNGLTLAQMFLVQAWHENESARYCLNGDAAAHGWQQLDAVEVGVAAAVGAAKSLAYAMRLMAVGNNRLGQAPK